MRPMRMPARASARRADWAPGPGVFVPTPPVARILMWRAVMPTCFAKEKVSTFFSSCRGSEKSEVNEGRENAPPCTWWQRPGPQASVCGELCEPQRTEKGVESAVEGMAPWHAVIVEGTYERAENRQEASKTRDRRDLGGTGKGREATSRGKGQARGHPAAAGR